MLRLGLALWRFVLPLIGFMVAWGFLTDAMLKALGLQRPVLVNAWSTMGFGLVLVAMFGTGLLLSWNLAALVWRLTRTAPRVALQTPSPQLHVPVSALLQEYQRIGIILAGGGAKGAYQAGAMRAVWEFLEEHGALRRVCTVAGTSIGAWNAMFWLAGLVRPERASEPSAHEAWWRAIRPERILDFDWYVPGRHNHLARPTPWRQAFRRLFVEPLAVRSRLLGLLSSRPDRRASAPTAQAPLHFYLTRSNVEHAVLEVTTNSWAMSERTWVDPRIGATVPVVDPSLYDVLDGAEPDTALRDLEEAVFASMDIPPVFPYVGMRAAPDAEMEWFEDGGVIENLPLIFGTAIDECDLLFVLPLNASFSAGVNHTSILARLSRVIEIRQGVIERHALKLAYLYNDLHRSKGEKEVSVFAICPAGDLAIGTMDFHKPREAAGAYRLMHEQTARVLRKDVPGLKRNWIKLVTIALDERNEPVIDYVEKF